jgi:uncharacterized protein (TIGR02646 family)
MISVTRSTTTPPSLTGATATNELAEAELYYGTWAPGDPAFGKFSAYSGNDVVNELRQMFHGKCAYCERAIEKGTREVEHYRPKGGVGEPNHPGYWWLAFSWTNLLPTCGPCNKGLKQHIVTIDMTVEDVEKLQAQAASQLAGKANHFPVGGARLTAKLEDHEVEQPWLLDPTRCKPENHLRWSHASDFSVLVPRENDNVASVEGQETIRCLALNRSGLVEARTKQLNILRAQRVRILERLEKSSVLPEESRALVMQTILESVEDMRLHCSPRTEFSAMATAFVRAFSEELAEWLDLNVPKVAPASA